MFKKTLIASAVAASFALTAQGVQANPVTNLINGLVNDVTSVQFDARRGGVRRAAPRSTAPRASATTTRRTAATDNKTAANNQQKDAQFSQNAARPNQNAAPAGAPAAAAAPAGGMGMGGAFISSLAGAGAGVLLANMLLTPTAAAAQGTDVATPDMLSDTQIDECLNQIKTDIEGVKQKLAEAAPEEQQALRDQLSKMNELQVTLLNEQINRLQKG